MLVASCRNSLSLPPFPPFLITFPFLFRTYRPIEMETPLSPPPPPLSSMTTILSSFNNTKVVVVEGERIGSSSSPLLPYCSGVSFESARVLTGLVPSLFSFSLFFRRRLEEKKTNITPFFPPSFPYAFKVYETFFFPAPLPLSPR